MHGLPTAPAQDDQVGLEAFPGRQHDGARAPSRQLDAVDRYTGPQLEVRALERGHEVGDRRAHAHAVDLVDRQ